MFSLHDSCVIIPCGGIGSRLQLPYPKELLALGPHRTLIDETFNLLTQQIGHVRVVVVIHTHKLETIRYLASYADQFDLAFVYQRSDLPGMIGAVLSAAPWFCERNLVLLPDQLLLPHPTRPNPVEAAFTALERTPFCFIAKQEHDPALLAEDGALRLGTNPDGTHHVLNYVDKSPRSAQGFNAVWVAFGFTQEKAQASLSLMHRCISEHQLSEDEFRASSLFGCPAILVSDYIDLGTWERFSRYWRQQRTDWW